MPGGEADCVLVKRGQGSVTLPSGGNDWQFVKTLVADSDVAGNTTVRRNCTAGSRIRFQHTGLINAKVARSSRRNTARGYRRGADRKHCWRNARCSAGGELVTALLAGGGGRGTQPPVDQNPGHY